MRLVLDINKMDVSNFTETWGYGLLFFAEADRMGLLLVPETDTRQKAAIMNASRIWLSKVGPALAGMRPGDAFGMLTMFDFLHRIVHKCPMPDSIGREHTLRAFRALQEDDESVNEYCLFSAVSNRIKHHDKFFAGEPLGWQRNVMDRWLDNLNNESATDSFQVCDRLQCATTVLRTDLGRFGITGEDALKASVRRRERHLLDDLTECGPARYDFRTYHALDQFLMTFRNELSRETYGDYEVRIHEALISAPDIDIYNKTYYEDYLSRYLRVPAVAVTDLS